MNDYSGYDDEAAEAAARDNDDYAAYMAHLEQESAPDCPFCGHPVDVGDDALRCKECDRTMAEVAVAESGELCPGCFFSFNPDELTAALEAAESKLRLAFTGPAGAGKTYSALAAQGWAL